MRIPKITKANVFLIALMMMAVLLCWGSRAQAAQTGDHTYFVTAAGKVQIRVYTEAGQGVPIPSTLSKYSATSSSQAQADQDGDYNYTVTDDEAKITKYTGAGRDVTIPSTLGGYFVTSIGDFAFGDCTNLTSIIIPQGVADIGIQAFAWCTGLHSIAVEDNNSYYTSIDGVLYSKDGTTLIACPGGLTDFSIPQGVTSIGDYAFNGCEGLTIISIPQGITSIGFDVFLGCIGLTNIAADDNNSCYASINGVLYSKDGTILIACPAGLNSMSIPSGVTSISVEAFDGCEGLTTISIPKGMTSIGDYAFSDCIGLTTIDIPQSVTSIGYGAFAWCDGLTTITFNSAATEIADDADTIPDQATIIGYDPSTAKEYATNYNRTFEVIGKANTLISIAITTPATKLTYNVGDELDLTGLVVTGTYSDNSTHPELIRVANITGFDSSLPAVDQVLTITVGGKTTNYIVTINSDIVTLSSIAITTPANKLAYNVGDPLDISGLVITGTYSDKSTQVEPIMETDVTGFDSSAPTTNQILTVTVSEKTATYIVQIITPLVIPDYTYTITANQAQITEYTGAGGVVTIPSTLGGFPVTSIGYGTFEYCTGLTSITIPAGVISIGDLAFKDCRGLTSITIPAGVTSIGNNTFEYCTGLTSITIPAGVISIGSAAFKDCTGLTSITIPAGVTSIGDYTFEDCTGLTSITIPAGVTIIYREAFKDCTGLTSITIPAGVTSIGDYAFNSCTGLTSITIPARVTSIGYGTFNDCTGLTSITFNSATTTIYSYYGHYSDAIPTQTKIIGYDPSTAKDYATKYGRTFELIGNTRSYIPVTKIILSSPLLTFDARVPQTLVATISPANVTYDSIKWESSDENVATVCNGVVTPKSVGTTTITVSPCGAVGVEQVECTVVVNRLVDYSLPANKEKDVLRKIALATIVGNDAFLFSSLGRTVEEVIEKDPQKVDGVMFTKEGNDVHWKDYWEKYIGSYKVLGIRSTYSDMQAATFEDENGDIIIAYRGTEPTSEFDLLTDLSMGLSFTPSQFQEALNYYKYIQGTYNKENKKRVSLTGHSLGGALAAYVSIREDVEADCFNDATGYILMNAYADQPEQVKAFYGINTTKYTSYLNIDADPTGIYIPSIVPLYMHFNNTITSQKEKRNRYEFPCNNYQNNDTFYYHDLASILTYNNGDFGLTASVNKDQEKIVNRPTTIINTNLFASHVILGTNQGDSIAADCSTAAQNIIYTGNGIDAVVGRPFVNDTIVASGKGAKFLYGMGGSDTYIIDVNQIDSKITIDDPSGWDKIILKNANVNDKPIAENGSYYYMDFGNNRSIYVKKTRDWFQPKIRLTDMNNNSRDFTVGSSSRLLTSSNALLADEPSQAGYTLKSLRLTGEVDVKVYDQQGVLLGEHDNTGNDVQTADYGYFYPVNTDDQKSMDIDLINGNYILKVTSTGSVDYTIYDPDAPGTISYEKTGIDLSDGTVLVIDTDFASAENKFALEKDQAITPITATEYVSAQQVTIDKSQIDLKAGLSATAIATVSPSNVVTGDVEWSVIQPDENSMVAGVITNEDGSATVTGFAAGNATLRATAQDSSGIYCDIPITVTQDSAPSYSAIDADGAAYSSGDWSQTSQVTVTAAMPGGYDQLYISDGNIWTLENSISITDPGQHNISFYAKNSTTGERTSTGSLQLNIDRSAPVIEGVTQDGEYYIDRLVQVTDDGAIASIMINGTTAFTADEIANGKWFTEAGNYTIKATDSCGNVTQISFVIKSILDSGNISATDLTTIQSVREEFESVKYELPSERRDTLELNISALEGTLVNLLSQAGTSTLQSIAITTPPTKLTYTAGETLDLTGLVVTLTKLDLTTQDVAFADFAANGITTVKANGDVLAATDTAVIITVDGKTVSQTITVNAAVSTGSDVTLTVSNPAITGFTVTLNPSLAGLTASNFALLDSSSQPVTITGVITSDSGATYAISAALTKGQTYTVTARDIGYSFGTPVTVALSAAPVYQCSSIDSSNKVVTLNFNEDIVNNLASLDNLKNAITFAVNGTDFVALGSNDTVSISGTTLVVTFNTALSGSTNKIKVTGNSIQDSSGNILSTEITTEAINAGKVDECFIATAAFGSKFTWPVALLREFRDQYLLTNKMGTAFVNFYYQHSPPIAHFIAGSKPLKLLVRILLAPVIGFVYLMYHSVLVLLIMLFAYCGRLRRRYVEIYYR